MRRQHSQGEREVQQHNSGRLQENCCGVRLSGEQHRVHQLPVGADAGAGQGPHHLSREDRWLPDVSKQGIGLTALCFRSSENLRSITITLLLFKGVGWRGDTRKNTRIEALRVAVSTVAVSSRKWGHSTPLCINRHVKHP